jgi:hypothetical protein
MRRRLPAILLAGFSLAAPPAGAPAAPAAGPPRLPASWTEFSTPHYTIRTGARQDEAKELADFMELVHKTYSALLFKGAPPRQPRQPFSIVLYASQRDFARAGHPAGAGAYYSPASQELVGFYHPVAMKPFFAHEGMHQFTDLSMPNFRTAGVPMWFVEGIADCIGNAVERDGKLYMCSLSGLIAHMRLPLVASLVRENRHIPLERLLAMDRNAFMANAAVCYAESWSFCHFLMTYPKREEPTKQIPDGKYRKAVSAYYETLLDRRATAAEAWQAARKAGGIDSLAALETEWKEYVLDIAKPDPESAFLGVTIDSERAAEGAVIGSTAPGSPAAKAGLQPDDVVVKIDGRPVELWNDFLATLRTKKPGERIVLAVRREGKEVSVPVLLEKRGGDR